MDKRVSPGTTTEECQAGKYYTPHFKAGGLTGIISPEAAEFIVSDENLVPEKHAMGDIQLSMDQTLRLSQMHEKVITDFEGKIELLFMQSKKSPKYDMYWAEQVQSLFKHVFQCMVLPEEIVLRAFIIEDLYPTSLKEFIDSQVCKGELMKLGEPYPRP
jgi:hypothetical protein